MTNIELVTNIMEFSKHGVMAQLVVMEAIARYVNGVVDTGLEGIIDEFGENFLINPTAWFRTCQEIKEKLDGRK